MIVPTGPLHYVGLFALVAVLGGIGGLVFELLQTYRGGTGTIEGVHRVSPHRIDLGVWANVIVGAAAAAMSLWAFPPTAHTVGTGANATTQYEYVVTSTVALALIVGAAGSSFISAFRTKAVSLLNAKAAEDTKKVAVKALTDLKTPGRSVAADQPEFVASIDASLAALNSIGVDPAGVTAV